ncbi:hypothetical protein GDO78_019693 [Eleutherodactylus coqui]|uniref:Tantalus-like domain-containing protein n=1 Tax=Eleutherodactylus coqui TaxID=57060 RepID=A0A8J6C6D0_ELECQ|nr:hypothetical protein GDO78_019693 [Eleutherodactylus coqui]KAG9464588.1 hypothetical protein GDO78_019693 [Eleutherodactylus coqui]
MGMSHEAVYHQFFSCRKSRTEDWTVCDRLGSVSLCRSPVITPSPTALPVSTKEPSHTFPTCPPPLSPPKEEPGWGLVPLFNSVRSKLESFAEIFLSPVKSRKDARNLKAGAHSNEPNQQDFCVPGEAAEDSVHSSSLSPVHHGVDCEECGFLSSALEEKSFPSQTIPANLRLQTEPSHSPSILCRPPLQRYDSCPLLPHRRHKRRHSLDVMEPTAEPYSCRRRRHSLGSVEECPKLALTSFSLSCLRKENHPSVLRQSPFQPGDMRKSPTGSVHSEGSPAGLGLDKDREPGLSQVEDQVTKESLPDSDFKDSGNHSRSKENKVSSIRIRKRVLRQEEKLTPLGLPKRVRLEKDDFSLEEIYTNKNYHTPTEKKKFETIFEEPVMKGGTLVLTSQRPLRRSMVFKNVGAAPRKRKKGKAVGRTRRCTAASAGENVNYELLLQHKLTQLEAALQEDTADP